MFNRSITRLGCLLLICLVTFSALGLVQWYLSLSSVPVQASANGQEGSTFLILPVEKTETRASVYTVTNVSTMTTNTTHEFWEVDLSFEIEVFHHVFTDELAPLESKSYDLAAIPEIPHGVVDEVQITSDKPITAISDICQPTIRSDDSGEWSDPATWDLNRLPNSNDVVMIEPRHFVDNVPVSSLRGLCNFGVLENLMRSDLSINASDFISNYGTIYGYSGQSGEVVSLSCGEEGGSLRFRVSNGLFLNTGRINAGAGGRSYKCPGVGGSILLTADGVINEGEICAGSGGETRDTFDGLGLEVKAGNGGDLLIWSRPGFVRNTGLLCGGDGGYGDVIAKTPHHGGNGGRLKIVALPNVFLDGGEHRGGRGGLGRAGGNDSGDGPVIIEPNVISLAGSETSVSGGDILIFGGDSWLLDLSNMSGMAIDASGNITLAVGAGGTVDLRGNSSQVLQAAGQVVVASDIISLDGGTMLTDVLGTNFVVGPSQIMYDVSLLGPGLAVGQPGVSKPISITVLNGGPATDTYTLPSTKTVAGLDLSEVLLQVTPPTTAISGTMNTFTVTAVSQANGNVMAVDTIEFKVQVVTNTLYLPVVFR